ncbi:MULTISPECIES: ATP-binding protein [Paenibacillus]|nr:ATP-binding protein [Paenibacillus anaericanus]
MGRAMKKSNSIEPELQLTERPNIPPGSHPVEIDDYQIPTNEIMKIFKSVSRWIQLRITGAVIYGRPRLGKTWMIKYLKNKIPTHLGVDLPIHHIVSLHAKIAKEEEFIESLLSDMDHAFALAGKVGAKRQRLLKFLEQQGCTNSLRMVVLFIDEAQCLDSLHFEWLMDYYNKLDLLRVTLVVFLVGQPQLYTQKTIYSRGHEDQIIQRFMIEEHKFNGLKNEMDIKSCLISFDERSEYPKDSGWSFTRYYFPEAFTVGERLQNFSKDIHDLYVELRTKYNIKGPFEIPMKHMIIAIKIIFVDHGMNSDKPLHWVTTKHWKEAILKTNYIASEQRKQFQK